jgi:hypothetical protein
MHHFEKVWNFVECQAPFYMIHFFCQQAFLTWVNEAKYQGDGDMGESRSTSSPNLRGNGNCNLQQRYHFVFITNVVCVS